MIGGFASGRVSPNSDSGQISHDSSPVPLSLTYIANCGALVSSGDSKVLIDALFDKPNPEYRAPAAESLDKIMKGAPPFDGVDLVLVTHNHPDHFDARMAVRFLETLPEPLLLAPADAVEEMRKAATDWAKIGPRVVSLDIKVGQKDKRDLKGISVTAFRTLHSGDRESPMNVMYLFELNGRRVFHEGDSTGKPESFQGFGLGQLPNAHLSLFSRARWDFKKRTDSWPRPVEKGNSFYDDVMQGVFSIFFSFLLLPSL